MTVQSYSCCPGEGDFFPLWRSPSQGPMDSSSTHLLEMLLPHVRMALRLRTKVVSNDNNLFSETALDAMSIAAILVTASGRVRHMNRRAAELLQKSAVLHVQHGRLTSQACGDSAKLEALVASASSGVGESGTPGGAMRLSCRSSQPALQLAIIPVPQQNGIAGREPCALVFVSDPTSAPRPRSPLLRQLYGLTPTESRLADLLLAGLDVREAADRLNITLQTARFHLKRVLQKTGARRQTELMRLMLSLPG